MRFVPLIIIGALFSGCYGPEVVHLGNEYSQLQKNQADLRAKLQTIENDLGKFKKEFQTIQEGWLSGKANWNATLDEFKVQLGKSQGAIDELKHEMASPNLKQENINLSQTVKALQDEVASLRKDLHDLRITVKDRLSEIKTASKPSTSKEPKSREDEETSSISKASSLYKEGKFDDAIGALKVFIKENPTHNDVGQAQFLLAECFFSSKDFPRAITEYQKVIDHFPSIGKVCHSKLKQGDAFLALNKKIEAKLFLEEVVSECKKQKEILRLAHEKLKAAE